MQTTINLQQKRWKLKTPDEGHVMRLAEDFPSLSPALWRLLALRGISNFDEAKKFFRPQLSYLHDPFLMKGMHKAVNRIDAAINAEEKIMVFGDYDVDGTTSVAIVYSFLSKRYKGHLTYYIPHRYREGYGVSDRAIDYAIAQGYKLIITLDCGIKSASLIKKAQENGIDVIVCDHHLPDDNLPPALAILNPKQKDCNYPFKELSGCGIGFKLIQALVAKWDLPKNTAYEYLDLVATSIAADIVPMDGENRILATFGLKKVNENPCLAIEVLKKVTGITKPMCIEDLVFVIGPRVNAAGRMDDARKAVEMFLCTDPEKTEILARELHTDNIGRKEVDKTITEEALELIRGDADRLAKKSTVVFMPHWHKGVIGIVASRLIEHYYRPTIVLTQSNGRVSGSARSVSGFNIYEAIHECRDLLENYGGHYFAAGVTMQSAMVDSFCLKFEEVVSNTIHSDSLLPEILIDAEICLKNITPKFFSILKQFEPCGPTNLHPLFISRNVCDYKGYSRLVKNEHIRFCVQQKDSKPMEGIGFNLAEKFSIVTDGPFDMVYHIEENEHNSKKSLQIKVVDVRPSKNEISMI